MQFFGQVYFEDLLAPITCAKKLGFLPDLFPKYSRLKVHYNQKIYFYVMHLEKVIYYVTLLHQSRTKI